MSEKTIDKKQAKNTVALYLIDQIIGAQKVKNVPNTTLMNLLYLTLLEYAYWCPNYTMPKNSAIKIFEWIKSENGPIDIDINNNWGFLRGELGAGRVPTFEQAGFSLSERAVLRVACSNIARQFSFSTPQSVSQFIRYELPQWHCSPMGCRMYVLSDFFNGEVSAFVKKRHMLMPSTVHMK